MLDLATVGCIFDFQERRVPFPKIAYAVTTAFLSDPNQYKYRYGDSRPRSYSHPSIGTKNQTDSLVPFQLGI